MKRKLKTLESILSSTYTFHESDGGVIRSQEWTNCIVPNMTKLFGQEIEVDEYDYNFDESWFEKPEKKKLYAYSVLIQRDSSIGDIHPEIIFSDKEFEKKGYTRKSEFDIEFGDDK